MYPDKELTFLAAKKAALRQRISARRRLCAEAAADAARPLEALERGLAWWRKFSPIVKIAAVPAALLLKRAFFRRSRVVGSVLRWGPLAFGAVRGLIAGRRH